MPTGFIKVPKYQGVYYRKSDLRRYQGKPDRCFYIAYKDLHGKKIWEKVGWDSEGYSAALAVQVRGERMRNIRHGEQLPKQQAKEITLAEVWKQYDKWLETGKRRPQDDRYYYRKHLEPRFAKKNLSKIAPLDLERLRRELYQQGLADQTVKHNLVIIRQLFNKAIAWGMWKGENPVKQVKMPKVTNRRERFLTAGEAEQLFEALGPVSSQLHDMALLSLHTGMRAGEIFALKWGHVDLVNGLIHIADPKGGESRKAFMTPTVKAMLSNSKLVENQHEEFVFLSRKGERISEVSSAFDRAIRRLGFNDGITDPRQKITFHSLRHTFASWLALQNTPILTIKELLGHKSLAMTERYSHLLPDHKRQAVDGIEKFVKESKTVAELKTAGETPTE